MQLLAGADPLTPAAAALGAAIAPAEIIATQHACAIALAKLLRSPICPSEGKSSERQCVRACVRKRAEGWISR